jgi:hypothetical protein
MNIKNIVSGLLIFILLVLTILTGCGRGDVRSENILDSFLKLIEEKDFNDLSLTIYYISPYILTRAPLSVDDLINLDDVTKIVVSSSELKEYTDLFKQLSKDDLIPVKNRSRINARLYYVFETVNDGKILDVAMWGENANIFINGLEVESNDIFYDIIMPFLPKEVADGYCIGN